MNPLARAIIRGAGSGFTYASVPSQLLRINSLEGSLGFSGSVLTSVTDVSAVGGTVNVTGSPVYTASDAGLNGAPSFTPVAFTSSIIAPNVNRALVKYVAAVIYRSTTGSHYFCDGTTASGRWIGALVAGDAYTSGLTPTAVAGEPTTGRKRILIAADGGAVKSRVNAVEIGPVMASAATGNGLSLAQNYIGGSPSTMAFFMACSAVPDSTTRAALEAKLITDFG